MLATHRHFDRQLDALVQGDVSPRGYRRLLRHATGCPRCAERLERAVSALRQLERATPFSPSEVEVKSLGAAGLGAALKASRPRPAALSWGLLATVGLAAAAALVLAVRPEAAWQARGQPGGRAVLRVFCAAPDASLRELPAGGSCAVGHKLAFGIGGAPSLQAVAIRLSHGGTVDVLGPFSVTTRPGAEGPLDVTPELSTAGRWDVTAAFAQTAERARAALDAARPDEVVLHAVVQVEASSR